MDPLEKLFRDVQIKDKNRIRSWLVSWEYQEKRKKRKKTYGTDKIEDFERFNGNGDLVKWMNWLPKEFPNYLPDSLVSSLIKKSRENDQKVLNSLSLPFDFTGYEKGLGIYNAQDFVFPNLYPSAEKTKSILDFGAGYGRQANLWASDQCTFIGMDSIANSYCLQHIYYKSLSDNFHDYINNADGFKINFSSVGIYHIPTWRYDLIPDNSIDLVICVQVLPELNSRIVAFMIKQFQRMLKKGGMLYLRDHGNAWKPGSFLNIDSVIQKNGFVLEFKPHVIDYKHIYGIPRIFRKIDPEVIRSQTSTFKKQLNQILENTDAFSGGVLSKMKQKIIRKQK